MSDIVTQAEAAWWDYMYAVAKPMSKRRQLRAAYILANATRALIDYTKIGDKQ